MKGVHPLHPPPRSAPVILHKHEFESRRLGNILLLAAFVQKEVKPASQESLKTTFSGRPVKFFMCFCVISFSCFVNFSVKNFLLPSVVNHIAVDNLTSIQQICMQILVQVRVMM